MISKKATEPHILNYMRISNYIAQLICVCIVGSSHSRIFHSFGDVIIAGEGLQILTNARYLWALNSGVSITCQIYCDTGHLRGPAALTPIAERLAVELLLPNLTN